jgi:hypothetical protein
MSTQVSTDTNTEIIAYDYSVDLDFIKTIRDNVTVSGALPFTVPIDNIPILVKRAAEKFFTLNEDSAERKYYMILQSDIQSHGVNKHVVLPSAIYAINDVAVIGTHFTKAMNVAKFRAERLLLQGTADFVKESQGLVKPKSDWTEHTAIMHELGHLQSVYDKPLSFNFNRNTHRLAILGDDEQGNIMLNCWVRVSLFDLYGDSRFEQYVTGLALMELAFILSVFGWQMPGNITLNYDAYSAKGERLMTEITDALEEENDNPIMLKS